MLEDTKGDYVCFLWYLPFVAALHTAGAAALQVVVFTAGKTSLQGFFFFFKFYSNLFRLDESLKSLSEKV